MRGHLVETGHDAWAALAVGHAMASLEPEDEQSFLAHLPTCSICAGVVADTRVVMAHLAYAVAPMEPPAALLESVRASIADKDRPPVQPRTRIGNAGTRRRAATTGRPWMAVAAGLVLLLALSIWNVVLQAANRSGERRLAEATLITNCVRDVACRTVQLRAPESNHPVATALVRGGQVQLVVDGLPRNDADAELYVLWQRVGQARMVALDSFDVTRPGVTVIRSGTLVSELDAAGALAVSREPGRTVPTAPTAVVAVGTVA